MLRDNLAGAHLADVQQARELTLSRCALTGTRSSEDRPPNALKIPARQGGIYALTENGASPLHAEPRQDNQPKTVLWLTENWRTKWRTKTAE